MPTDQTRVIVLVPEIRSRRTGGERGDEKRLRYPAEERLTEATGLARAIDLNVVFSDIVGLPSARPATLFGRGKVDEMAERIAACEAELVVVDHALTPIQQRNLERQWQAKVLDRTGLILEIFGHRARTREGRLQVELAHLTFQRSRLVRSWTHLERQRGGFGFLGGPGETQIETDRRLLQERIQKIRKELSSVSRTRALHRKGRRQVPYPIVAIVGYTNAGKSTLFNRLTDAAVLVQDQVFATLDPTMREVALPSRRKAILSDTVGFISDLPTMLVAAFRATLEEVVEADLLLHVRNIAHPETEAQRADVEDVLKQLGLTVEGPESRLIEVWNKIDLLSGEALERLESQLANYQHAPVMLSAATGEGCDRLTDSIDSWLGRGDIEMQLVFPAASGRLTHWLHENATVLQTEGEADGNLRITFRISEDLLGRLDGQMKTAGVLSRDHMLKAAQ